MLDLSGNLVRLEATDHGTDLLIVRRIQGIDDGLGTFVCHVQCGQEAGNVLAAGVLGDHVDTGVGTHFPEHSLVGIPVAAVVELHGNIKAMISLAKGHQDCGLIFLRFFCTDILPFHDLLIGCLHFLLGSRAERNIVKAMVTRAAANLRKEFQTLDQGINHFPGGSQFLLADRCSKLTDVGCKSFFVDVDRLIRAEGRADLYIDRRICGNLLMPL